MPKHAQNVKKLLFKQKYTLKLSIALNGLLSFFTYFL